VLAPIISLAAFLLGTAARGVLVNGWGSVIPRLVACALELEVSLLAVTAVLATSVHPGDASGYAHIVLMSFAMGVRTRLAAHRRTGPDDNRAHDDTDGPASGSRPTGGSRKGSIRRLAAALAMLAGASSGALLLR
jgi:uncharacterized membrane protein YoaK (UPF0700 family)